IRGMKEANLVVTEEFITRIQNIAGKLSDDTQLRKLRPEPSRSRYQQRHGHRQIQHGEGPAFEVKQAFEQLEPKERGFIARTLNRADMNGYDSVGAIRRATSEEILRTLGIGKLGLQLLRGVFGTSASDQ